MFKDSYTHFSFNELNSDNFKVWVTNNHNLKHNMTPNFKDQFDTPTYGQFRYYKGSTIENQDIQLSCIAINVTQNDWRAITEWLSPLTIGKLRLHWNPQYYYMVKVGKQITGEQWVFNKVDPILGNLYNVTFTINFTTVNDWAALGESNEDIVVRSVLNAYTKSSLESIPQATKNDIYYITNENKYYICNTTYDSYEYKESYWTLLTHNSSIFNNSYYMPSIISVPNAQTIQLASQAGFWGSKHIKFITDSTEDFEINVYNISFQQIGTIKYVTQDGAESLVYTHFIEAANSSNVWDEVLTKNVPEDKDSTEWYFMVKSSAKEFFVLSTIGFAPKIVQYEVENAYYSCICNNTGAYDMYPQIYSTIPYSLYDDSTSYCSFEYNGSQPFSYYTTLNSYNRTLTSYGVPIDALVNNIGVPVYKNIHNNQQLIIPTGRPQFLKTIVYNTPNQTYYNVNFKDWYTITISLCINSRPIYDRYKPYTCSFFKRVVTSNNYDNDIYGTNYYSVMFNEEDYVTYFDPQITYEQTDQGWLMNITVTNKSLLGNLDLLSLEENEILYVSLCDSYVLGFDVAEKLSGTISLNIRARDVI